MKRWAWLVPLSLLAALIGLVAAPQALFVVDWLVSGWLPLAAVVFLRHAAYEAGLFGSGLTVWIIARRLGWLAGVRPAVLLVLSPAVVEGALFWLLHRWPPGLASVSGAVARAVVGIAAVGWAIYSARHATAAHASAVERSGPTGTPPTDG